MARFYALTTTNADEGWSVLGGPFRTRHFTTHFGVKVLLGRHGTRTTAYDTARKNLRVVPSSRLPSFGWTEATALARLERIENESAGWEMVENTDG